MLVGVVFATLLHGLLELSGGALLADRLLHVVVPILVPLYWLAFVFKGRLPRRDPFLWTLLPLAYYVYALVRGAAENRYPYPFMNIARIGWGPVGAYAAAMAIGLLAMGCVLVWVDGQMAVSKAKTSCQVKKKAATGSANVRNDRDGRWQD